MHIMKVRTQYNDSKLFIPRIVSFPLVWLMLCKKTRPIQGGLSSYVFALNHSESIHINSLLQVQQQNPAVKGVRPHCPLDPARAGPGGSEG